MTTDKPYWNSKEGRHATYLKRKERLLKYMSARYHIDPVGGAAKEAAKRKRCQASNPARYMIGHIRSRAKRSGIPFTITEKDIRVPEYCPVLGIKLEFGDIRCFSHSPTLDRKDNSKGYTPDNVWVISHRANTMKGNSTMEELRTFCLACLKHMESGELSEVAAHQNGTRSRWDQAVSIDRGTSSILED